MKRYCLTLDLKDDPYSIEEYKRHHKNVWPEIITSIKDTGIHNMEIYLYANRLFMIMETEDSFSFEEKNRMDKSNPRVQEWEKLMWKYQQALNGSKPGEKWGLMERVFKF